MCVPRVAQIGLGGKPPIGEEPCSRVEGWAPYGGRRDSQGEPHEAPTPPREMDWTAEGRALFRGILDTSLGQGAALDPRADRRAAGRILKADSGNSAITLTPSERGIARSQLVQAARCGSGYVALRGYEVRPDGDRETRMVVQTHCGTRRCDECQEAIRERQRERSNGPWRLFFTLTLPRAGTAAQAWRKMHARLKIWHREIRRELAISRREWPEKGSPRWEQRQARIIRAQQNVRGDGAFQYAWVLESHKDGWPHAHECVSLEWIRYSWARSLWRWILRDKRARIDGRRVWDVKGTCRYLSKYIAKARLAPEILAIIRGRRVWASTMPADEKEVSDWGVEPDTDSDEAKTQAENPLQWARATGWNLECGKDSVYARWWRPARNRPEVEMVDEGDDSREARFFLVPGREHVMERAVWRLKESSESKASNKGGWHNSC